MAGKNTKKRNTGLAVAICLLVTLLVLILFLVKKDQIITNLQETKFFERIGSDTPEFVQNHVPTESQEEKIPLEEEVPLTINIQEEPKKEESKVVVTVEEPKKEEKTKIEETPKAAEKKAETKPKEVKKQTMELQLCFVQIGSDGSLTRKMIKRNVEKSDSPLTSAINNLLLGPNSSEANCKSLIPRGSKLLSARVSNGVAYLNFNEDFEFNSDGVEGQLSQLMQIVYTATTFSTVNSVQFLIEGEQKEYLGSEAVWIGSPLNRNSF